MPSTSKALLSSNSHSPLYPRLPPTVLFFIYGSGQGEIYNSDELRRFANIISNDDRDKAEGFLGRLNHGKLSVFDNDSGFTVRF